MTHYRFQPLDLKYIADTYCVMKFNLKILTGLILISCYPLAVLNANPSGGSVVSGSASFNQQGNTLNITNSAGTIINWQNFSIQEGETTKFIQKSVDSAVLNRVTTQNPSQILGSLQSNGRVFIINPNGISFGKNSIVDVGGLVASTLNLSNEDFLSQQLNFTGDGTNGAITNKGQIITPEGGFVYLIAPNIENHGVITSPNGEVLLAAGHSVQLVNSDDPDIRVTIKAPDGEVLNVGEIITRGGKTSIYAGLINQQGTVNADSAIVGKNGKIFFKSTKQTTLSSTSNTSANGVEGGSVIIKTTQGLTEVSGVVRAKGLNGKGGRVEILGEHVGILDNANIDASGLTGGGTVLIGGDNKGTNPNVQNAKATYVGVNSQIHADANNEGDGGTVIVWSDDATRAYGTITAKGGSVFGNGGFVETSGGYLDIAGIDLDVTAVNGNGGLWLLDPYNITISGTTTVNSTTGPTYTPTATGSNIFAGDIVTQLNAGTSVIVDTTGGGAESGNITVDASIIKTVNGGAATLTLKAHNNIITNNNIGSTSGALDIILTADQDSNGVGSVTLNGMLNSLNGNITVSAAGDVTLNSGTNTINAGTGTVSLSTVNGILNGDPAGAPTDVTAGSITLNSDNGIYANGGSAAFTVNSSNVNFTNTNFGVVRIQSLASVIFNGSSVNGDIILETPTAINATINNVTASNGYISVRSYAIDITGAVNAGANSVYLMSSIATDPISIDGASIFDLSSAEISNVTAGNIFIGKDTLGNESGSVSIASAIATNFGGKNIWISADNGVTFGANNVTNIGGQLYLDNITSGNITTGNGLITADNIQFSSIGNVNIGTGGINSTAAGNVYLFGADVNIAGAINAGTNQVFLAPYLNGTSISIEGTQVFNLTSADLNNITAGSITIGENLGSAVYASTVDVASSAAVNIGAQTLKVQSNNNITFGVNNFTATGGDVSFRSETGTLTTGTGLVSSDILVLEGAGLVSVGTGGITSTNYAGLNGGDIFISGTVTSPIFYLSVFNPGSAISIGGVEAFNVAQADIDFINATTTYIGNNPYVTNTNNVDIATASTIDFGARSVEISSYNGVLLGAQAFKATGGNLKLISSNTGADITTGAGNIAADSVTMQSGRDIVVNSGGINSVNSITLTANNTVSQNGNLTANGTGTITVTATNQDITMAAGTITTGGNGDVIYNSGNNITVASLDSGFADVTLNASAAILDLNGNGVNNINANNLTVSSGGNASLDYQITGTLASAGVVGTADLRIYPATATPTPASSTNEPITTTIDTISATTNSLSTDTSLTNTTTTASTAPLADTTTEDTTDTTTSSTTEEAKEEESKEETQTASAEENKKQPKQATAKKLPICK